MGSEQPHEILIFGFHLAADRAEKRTHTHTHAQKEEKKLALELIYAKIRKHVMV